MDFLQLLNSLAIPTICRRWNSGSIVINRKVFKFKGRFLKKKTMEIPTIRGDSIPNGLFGGILNFILFVLPWCNRVGLRPRWNIVTNLYGRVVEELFDINYRPRKAHRKYNLIDLFALKEKQKYSFNHSRITFLEAHNLFFQFFKWKKQILVEVDKVTEKFSKGKTLGVHYRGTDKFSREASRISVDLVIEIVEVFLSYQKTFKTVFVATDTPVFLAKMKKRLGDDLIVHNTEIEFPKNTRPLHFQKDNKKGQRALIESICLSRTDFVVKTASQLSAWAKLWNPELSVWTVNELKSRIFPDSRIPTKREVIDWHMFSSVWGKTGSKILSFCCYGTKPLYNRGVLENALLAPEIYPGWQVWVFYNGMDPNILIRLRQMPHVKCILIHLKSHGRMWRFIPAFYCPQATVVVRDSDSRINNREKEAVDHWLNSNKPIHVMRDHVYHTASIMAGMWGCRRNVLHRFRSHFVTYIKTTSGKKRNCDQVFLQMLYPKLKHLIFSHSSITTPGHLAGHPFPSSQQEGFVGQRIYTYPLIHKTPSMPQSTANVSRKPREVERPIVRLKFNKTSRSLK